MVDVTIEDDCIDIIDTEEIQKILKKLASDGLIFILCPHCNIQLSAEEHDKLSCTSCNKKFTDSTVLYIYNKGNSQKN